jgi:hypothetical protein
MIALIISVPNCCYGQFVAVPLKTIEPPET